MVGVRKCMSHGKGQWRHGEVGMAAGQRSWHPPAPQRTDRRGAGALRGLLPPNVPGPRGPGGPPARPAAALRGATDLRPQPCRGRQRCCWLCSGDVSVRNGALQPNQRLAADQSPRARTALARSCPVGPPGPRGLSPDAGAECGSIPQRPALRAGAARCRLCSPPPTFLAGREGGSCCGCGFLPRLPVGSLWEVQSPRPVSIGLPTQRVFHGGAAGGSPHRRATWGDVQMSAGDLGRCATSSGNTGDSSPRAPGRASVRRWSWGVSEGSCTLS